MFNAMMNSPQWLAAGGILLVLLGLLIFQQRKLARLRAAQAQQTHQQELNVRDWQSLQTLQQQQIEQLQVQIAKQEQETQRLTENLREQTLQVQSKQRQADIAQTQLQALQAQLQQQLQQLEQQQSLLHSEQTKYAELGQQHAALNSTLEQKELQFAQQQQLLKDSREQLKLEFEQLAGQIFEARSQTFAQSSQQSLDNLLKPLREQINGFRLRVEDIHHKDAQQQATLAEQLRQLQTLNHQITQEAHDLTQALKGQKKMQGNWGELLLENVLERAGLVAGRDYDREVSFNAEDGRRRPDAIVYLPQSKHLIIDAKVSLNAYTRLVNAEDEAQRKIALDEHVKAVGERIRELADRNYYELPGLNAPEMVFMFIPIESAFVEALKGDETLFQRAIERNVLVATPTTLLTSLNIVRQLWRFEDQSRHAAELADRAAKVYDKLRNFLGSMDGIEKSLEKAQEAYRKARDQLVDGRGNLVKQVNEFRQLGVAVKTELAEPWLERAELELNLPAALEAEPD